MKWLIRCAVVVACLLGFTGAPGTSAAQSAHPVQAAVEVDPNAPHDFPDRPVTDDYPVAALVADGAPESQVRQCGMFALWRIDDDRHVPRWSTLTELANVDAAAFDDVARALGYRVDHVPAVGSVGVMNFGWNGASDVYGHAFYVARIFTDGSLLIEQVNWDGDGRYGTAHVPASWASDYVHLTTRRR